MSAIVNIGGKYSFFLVSPVTSAYEGVLSHESPVFIRPYRRGSSFYYQAIQVTISVSGTCTFTSYSSMNISGYLYTDTFDLSAPIEHLNHYAADFQQRPMTTYLPGCPFYFLIVRTDHKSTGGRFALVTTGP